MHTPETLPAHLRESSSCRLAVALWGGLAVVDACRLTGAPPAVTLAGLALLVAACSRHLDLSTSLLAAGVCWLVFDGFVVNRLGTLHVSGPGDLLAAALLVLAAVTGAESVR